MVFNPLMANDKPEDRGLESTSRVINDTMGVCPKCKQPFGFASAEDDQVYFCEKCCVTQPIPSV